MIALTSKGFLPRTITSAYFMVYKTEQKVCMMVSMLKKDYWFKHMDVDCKICRVDVCFIPFFQILEF